MTKTQIYPIKPAISIWVSLRDLRRMAEGHSPMDWRHFNTLEGASYINILIPYDYYLKLIEDSANHQQNRERLNEETSDLPF